MTRRRPLRPLTACALALAASTLFGCSPEPAPTPSPSPAFASEEEAFAAAEETYRAYVDAGNARRAGQPSPDPQDFLVGNALEEDIDASNLLDGGGLQLRGDVELIFFAARTAAIHGADADVTALVCSDATSVRLIDSLGVDVTPLERPDRLAEQITMTLVNETFRISSELPIDDPKC
jgi:hypothetical protein